MKSKVCIAVVLCMLVGMLAGCGSADLGEASVQSVSMICGLGNPGVIDRFAGVVSARSTVEIKKDDNKEISEIKVKADDNVTEGQVLFSYDMEQAQLNLEKAQLELQQLQASLASKEASLKELQKQKDRAGSAAQLAYTIEIQECETSIREINYNIATKEKEVSRIETALDNLDVTSPVNGRVTELNEDGGYDNYGNPLCFIKILETGSYRVKGYINENNVYMLSEGTPVVVRSRLDDSVTWTGMISMIDWENPAKSGNDNFYYGDTSSSETGNSSKYPFYAELDDATGLLLGQHVYIEPDLGQSAEEAVAIMLPSYYIVDADSSAWVWAENDKGKLEKRTITLGEYDEMMDTYAVVSGLTADDFIAYPEENLKAGMTCVEFSDDAFNVDDMYYEGGFEGGFEGEFEGGFEGEFEGGFEEGPIGEFEGEGFGMEEGFDAEEPEGETKE